MWITRLLDRLLRRRPHYNHSFGWKSPPIKLAEAIASSMAERPSAWRIFDDYYCGEPYIVHQESQVAVSIQRLYLYRLVMVAGSSHELGSAHKKLVIAAADRWLAHRLTELDNQTQITVRLTDGE